jgi:hypothetical protein
MKITQILLTMMTTFLWFSASAATAAGNLSQIPLNAKIGLLEGRLVVIMPKGSRVEPRGHSIMGAPQPEEDESRVVVESGREKLVLMAEEAYAMAGKDFRSNVSRFYKQFEEEDKTRYVAMPEAVSKGGLRYVRVTEEGARKIPGEEQQLVAQRIVSTKDGAVQFLSLYANPEAAKDWSGVSALAGQILDSVAPGPRSLNRQGRTIPISDRNGLSITLPADAATSRERGPDFVVVRCFKLKEFGEPETSLAIYSGGHPDFSPTGNKAKKFPASILGQRIEWFESMKGSEHRLDALVPVPGEDWNVLHLFISAPDSAGLEEMKKTAQTLSIDKSKASKKE